MGQQFLLLDNGHQNLPKGNKAQNKLRQKSRSKKACSEVFDAAFLLWELFLSCFTKFQQFKRTGMMASTH